MFSAIGQHALGELIETIDTVSYDTVSKKTGNFTALNFKVRDDYIQPEADVANKFAVLSSNYVDVTIANGANDTLVMDTELVDADNIVSLASNVATTSLDGWYEVSVVVEVTINSGSPVSGNGTLEIRFINTGTYDVVSAIFAIPAGVTVNGRDFFASQPMELLSSGTFSIKVYNNTGDSLAAFIIAITVTKK